MFGLTITSSWGNGHATVYRGLLKALHREGVESAFVEKDVPWYASNRDMPWAEYARIETYRDETELEGLLASELDRADVVLLGSYFPDGQRVADELARRPETVRLYYDIDTPVTLEELGREGAAPYLRAEQVPTFEAVLSFTGGGALAELEQRWGARRAVAFYCALDPETHFRVDADDRFGCRLSYIGTYSADRHAAWEKLFLRPATQLPDQRFVLAGPQYPTLDLSPNVVHYQHVPPAEHSALYSSSDLTLNLTRGPMVRYGFSPSVRLFEAGGCATCVVSDRWPGLGELFEVGQEVLVADGEDDLVALLRALEVAECRAIGERFRARVLREHTYGARAAQFLEVVTACRRGG